jgi:hypothetical protein
MPSLKSAGMSSAPATHPINHTVLHKWMSSITATPPVNHYVLRTFLQEFLLSQMHNYTTDMNTAGPWTCFRCTCISHAILFNIYIFKGLFDTQGILEDTISLSTKLQSNAENDQIHKTETDHCQVSNGSLQLLLHLGSHFRGARLYHGDPVPWNINWGKLTCIKMIQ